VLIAAAGGRHGIQALVPAALSIAMICAGVLIIARLRAGRYPEEKVTTQRLVSAAFVVTGAAFLVAALAKL
jgi:hypothetical protein